MAHAALLLGNVVRRVVRRCRADLPRLISTTAEHDAALDLALRVQSQVPARGNLTIVDIAVVQLRSTSGLLVYHIAADVTATQVPLRQRLLALLALMIVVRVLRRHCMLSTDAGGAPILA